MVGASASLTRFSAPGVCQGGGINGVYHHVSHEHLPIYLAEFDFRYNARSGLGVSDPERAGKLLKGLVGKRLTYQRPDKASLD